jgi:hypothetical protein
MADPDPSLMSTRWSLIAWLEDEAGRVESTDRPRSEELRREAKARRNAIAQDSHHVG